MCIFILEVIFTGGKKKREKKREKKRDRKLICQIRDHASLFIFSPHLARILSENGEGPHIDVVDPDTLKPFEHRSRESLHRILATGIYKTQDNRFYHVHG